LLLGVGVQNVPQTSVEWYSLLPSNNATTGNLCRSDVIWYIMCYCKCMIVEIARFPILFTVILNVIKQRMRLVDLSEYKSLKNTLNVS